MQFCANQCKNLRKENSSFKDLKLSIDLCLIGSKYIKMNKFVNAKPLKSLRLHSFVNTKENEDVEKKMKKKML